MSTAKTIALIKALGGGGVGSNGEAVPGVLPVIVMNETGNLYASFNQLNDAIRGHQIPAIFQNNIDGEFVELSIDLITGLKSIQIDENNIFYLAWINGAPLDSAPSYIASSPNELMSPYAGELGGNDQPIIL